MISVQFWCFCDQKSLLLLHFIYYCLIRAYYLTTRASANSKLSKHFMSKSDRIQRCNSQWPCRCCSSSPRFIMMTLLLATTTVPISLTRAFSSIAHTSMVSHRHHGAHTTRLGTLTRMLSSTTANNTQSQVQRRTPNTGGLRRLPVVKRSTEMISRAKRAGWQVKPDATIKNARNRARKHGAERLDAITKELCVPLRDAIQGYRNELRRLHPFERVVADLTVRARERKDGLTLEDVLVRT